MVDSAGLDVGLAGRAAHGERGDAPGADGGRDAVVRRLHVEDGHLAGRGVDGAAGGLIAERRARCELGLGACERAPGRQVRGEHRRGVGGGHSGRPGLQVDDRGRGRAVRGSGGPGSGRRRLRSGRRRLARRGRDGRREGGRERRGRDDVRPVPSFHKDPFREGYGLVETAVMSHPPTALPTLPRVKKTTARPSGSGRPRPAWTRTRALNTSVRASGAAKTRAERK